MIGLNRTNKPSYHLPEKHINGFSRIFRGTGAQGFLNVLEVNVRAALRQSGFTVSGKLF